MQTKRGGPTNCLMETGAIYCSDNWQMALELPGHFLGAMPDTRPFGYPLK